MTADDQKELALNAARRALGGADNSVPAGAAALQRQADQLAGMGDWGPGAEDVNRRLLELDPQRKVAMTRLARCLRGRAGAPADVHRDHRALGAGPRPRPWLQGRPLELRRCPLNGA